MEFLKCNSFKIFNFVSSLGILSDLSSGNSKLNGLDMGKNNCLNLSSRKVMSIILC